MSSTAWQPWPAAAGSTMTLIGHLFDTLKTRMQTNNAYASTMGGRVHRHLLCAMGPPGCALAWTESMRRIIEGLNLNFAAREIIMGTP